MILYVLPAFDVLPPENIFKNRYSTPMAARVQSDLFQLISGTGESAVPIDRETITYGQVVLRLVRQPVL